MKSCCFLIQLALVIAMLLLPLAANAIQGNYPDAGGGEYLCNVFVENITPGYSFNQLTDKNENTFLNEFRGFESEHNGTISTEFPTIKQILKR